MTALGGIIIAWITASIILAPFVGAFLRARFNAVDDAFDEADGRPPRDAAPHHAGSSTL
jgi:hypothetical protein